MVLLPFVLLAATAGALLWHFPAMPERVPIHWNLHGLADGFAPKTVFVVLAPVATMTLMCLFFAFLRWTAPRMARLKTLSSDASRATSIELVRKILLATQMLLAMIAALLAAPLLGAPGWTTLITLPLGLPFMAYVFWIGRKALVTKKP